MSRKPIAEKVKRQLWAESMGRCMNPHCQTDLFINGGDIIEKAHIRAYSETEDNSFENLIILCPTCHKKFDKTNSITKENIKEWKDNRRKELEKIFAIEFSSFDELKRAVIPLLERNDSIYCKYYSSDNKKLWDKFEPEILSNNNKLKLLFENNRGLFQKYSNEAYSNLKIINEFITHVEEFKATRNDEEKIRVVLFPEEIYSIFGIRPINDKPMVCTESIEELLKTFRREDLLEEVNLGIDKPYILLNNGEKIFIDDAPRLRQIMWDNNCFRKTSVRLDRLNYALKQLKIRGIEFEYADSDSLREIKINGNNIVFVYEYCLNKIFLYRMTPKPGQVIVNLHNWNGKQCISKEALELADELNVTLLTTSEYCGYINEIK